MSAGVQASGLTEALKQNKSLRRMRVNIDPRLDRSKVFSYLDRNRQLFTKSSRGGMRAVLNSSGLECSTDVAGYAVHAGSRYMTERDLLNLSSVTKAAWSEHERILSERDPST